MKNRIISFMKKQWLLIWVVLAAMTLCSVIAFAEYPGTNNFMKRVVLSDDSSDMMFSSNLLTLIENDKVSYQPYYVRQLTNTDVAQTYDVDVFVWNYDIDGTADYYKRKIEYDLEISVVDNQGNVISSMDSGKVIQIVKNDSTVLTAFDSSSSSYTYIKSEVEELDTGIRSQNKYTIKFSKNWNLRNDTNKRVMIKATPTSDYPDLKPLAAAIGLKEEQSSTSNGWKYYISEQRLSGSALPSAYDAFNLVMNGTGSETIEIEWDPAVLELNKDFYESGGAFPFASGEMVYTQGGGSVSGWDKLVINADSYDGLKGYRNRYDIQMYKVNGDTGLGSSWNFIAASQTTGVYITINIPTDSET